MDKRERARVEHIGRVGRFGTSNAADWTPGGDPTPAQRKTLELFTALNTPKTGFAAVLEKFETGQQAGEAGFHGGTTSKSVLRHGIMLDMGEWNEAAAAIASAQNTPAIMDGFRVPHGVSAETLGAKVRAICDNAVPLQAQFVALGFADDFIEEMRERVISFEEAKDEKETALQTQTGSRGGLGATIREALKITKQLNVLMKKLYKGNADKLAAWATAFRTDRVGTSGKSKAKAKPAPELEPVPA